MLLIAEKLLEGGTTPDQAGTVLTAHFLACGVIVLVAEMMPNAKSQRESVLISAFADSFAVLGGMFNRGVYIQMSGQQARQATAVLDNGFHAIALVLASSWCTADHQEFTAMTASHGT